MARNYAKENRWQAQPEQVARRVQRNQARAEAMKRGLVEKGDGKEVDHIGKNRRGKLNNNKVRVVPKAVNRRKQPKRDGSQD